MKISLAMAALAQVAAGASAQIPDGKDASALAPPSANKWVAHTSDDRCWLIRGADAPNGTVFTISHMPGNERTGIAFVNPGWRRSPIYLPRKVEVSLGNGETIKADVYFDQPYPGEVHGPLEQSRVGFGTDRAVLDRIAESGALSLSEKGRQIARTTLPMMKKALAALDACESEALQAWGIDAAAWRALRSKPRPITKWTDILSSRDYSRKAIGDKAQGNVLIRLTVDATGKPIGCRQILRTGHEHLDDASCSKILQRARFEPAIDSNGRPVAAPYVTMVAWRLF